MGDRSTSSGVRNIRAMFEAKNESTTSPPSRGRSPAGSDGTRSISSRPISKARTSFIAVEKSGAFGPILGLRRLSDSVEANGEVNAETDNANEPSSNTASKKNANGSVELLRTGGLLSKVNEEEGGTARSNGKVWTGQKTQIEESALTNFQHSKPLEDISTSASASTGTPSIGIVLKGSPFEPLPGEEAPASSKQNSKTAEVTLPVGNLKLANGETKATSQKAAPAKAGGFNSPTLNTKATAQPGAKLAENSRMAKSNQPSPVAGLKTPTAVKVSPSKASPKPPVGAAPTTKGAGSSKAEPTHETSKSLPQKQSRSSLVDRRVEPRINTKSSSKKDLTRKTSSSNLAAATTVDKTKPGLALDPPAKVPKLSRRSSTGFLKPPPKSPTRPVALPACATASTAASAAKTGHAIISRSPSRATKTDRAGLSIKTDRLSAVKGPKTANALRSKTSRVSLEPERPRSSASSKLPDEGFLARMMRPTASSASKTHEKAEPKSPPQKLAPQQRKSSTTTAENHAIAGGAHAIVSRDDTHEASTEPGALKADIPPAERSIKSETEKRPDHESTAEHAEAAGISALSPAIATWNQGQRPEAV